jgi:TolB-like protein
MKDIKKLFRKPQGLGPFLRKPITFYCFLFALILELTNPPSGLGSPPISIEKRVTIAVANLTSNALSRGEIAQLTASLRNSLVKTGHFQVVREDYMKSVFTQQNFLKSEQCDKTGCLVEMGKLLGVEKVVGGTIGKSGNMVNISLWLVNVATGELEWEFQEKLEGGLDDLPPIINSFANKLPSLKEKEMKMEQERIAREKEQKIKLEEERQQLKQEKLEKGPPWLIIGGVLAAGGLVAAVAGSTGSDSDGGQEAVSVVGVWSLVHRSSDYCTGTINFDPSGTLVRNMTSCSYYGTWSDGGNWTYTKPTLQYVIKGITHKGSVTASSGTFTMQRQDKPSYTETISR